MPEARPNDIIIAIWEAMKIEVVIKMFSKFRETIAAFRSRASDLGIRKPVYIVIYYPHAHEDDDTEFEIICVFENKRLAHDEAKRLEAAFRKLGSEMDEAEILMDLKYVIPWAYQVRKTELRMV